MTNKFEKHQGNLYQRLSEQVLNKGTIVTPDVPPKAFISQMNGMIYNIALEYGKTPLGQKLIETIDTINIPVGDPSYSKGDMALQKKVDHALRGFGEVFKRTIEQDGGKKMLNVVNGSNLRGMPFVADEIADQRKIMFADESLD